MTFREIVPVVNHEVKVKLPAGIPDDRVEIIIKTLPHRKIKSRLEKYYGAAPVENLENHLSEMRNEWSDR